MNRYIHKTQKGFTLIELMIGIVVGFIAISATLSAFIAIVRSNADYLSMVKLNQELNAVMTIMVRDLKRAGYDGDASGITSDNPFLDPYPATINGNNIYIGAATNFTSPAGNDCITFTYDLDGDGAFDGDDERFGYRHDSDDNAIEMRDDGNECDEGSWEGITDDNLIEITSLAFNNDSISLDSTASEEIRYIGITLTGHLKRDTGVSRTLTERVRIRNDRP